MDDALQQFGPDLWIGDGPSLDFVRQDLAWLVPNRG
jgi:hypothetical protein